MRTCKSIYFFMVAIAVVLWAAPVCAGIYEGPDGEIYYGDFLPPELEEKGYRLKGSGSNGEKAPASPSFNYVSNDGRIIDITPATPLHKKSKEFIFSIRKSKVAERKYLNIFPENYLPSRSIFGQVDERAGWVNDVQFFVSNPYLLVLTSGANKVNALMPFCDVPSVEYSQGKITATYRGQSARRWFHFVYDYYGDSYSGIIRLWFVNAWDAGFRYAHVDATRSENVNFNWHKGKNSVVRGVYSGREFFHVGHLAKNNISPVDARARVKLVSKGVRTVLYIKLWREQPESSASPEDLGHVIVIEP